MRFASRTEHRNGKGSSAWDMHYIASERVARGEQAIFLTVGDTDFASPSEAKLAASDSLRNGRTHYTASVGEAPIREAIARRHRRQTGQTVDPDQVIVTVGAQNALFTAAMCIVDPGDEVIVPEPMYVTYPGTIFAAGGETISVRSPAENGFHPLIGEIEKVVTERTRAIFLATPNNPTGAVYTAEELAKIGEICRRRDLWLVSDEVYGNLVYEGATHISPASLPELADRTITVGSLSKSHAMAGWRLGWMVAPMELAQRAAQLTVSTTYGIPTFVQDAAIVALETYPDGLPELKRAYADRRARFCDQLDAVPGLACRKPEGGMFMMVNVQGTGISAYEFAKGLVIQEGVATLPADDFGASAAGYLRINLGAKDEILEEAMGRITRYAMKFALQSAG